jgi:GT2 family glycosyltransferase
MYIPGASIAASTAFLRGIGGFHRDFFMYGEDVELCARVLEAGRSVWVVPSARVYHYEPPERGEDPGLAYHKHKNLFALYLLHAPLRVLPGFFVRYGLIEGVRRLARPSPATGAWLSAFGFAIRRSLALLAQRSGPRVP